VPGIRPSNRETISLDAGWRFAFGHPYDAEKDFRNATGYFSFITKTGYGDGPASADFDDRAWRLLDVPHDWAVELPCDPRGGHSHGYRSVGRAFPETSVAWYRKSFPIPAEDLGRWISIEFDGVHRDAMVWVNGFYLGRERSGYDSFAYDITDYLNYGGDNLVSVRADVTFEEGWFYEGAGIYRHVRLVKTNPVHIARYGVAVSTETKGRSAWVSVRTNIVNRSSVPVTASVFQKIARSDGRPIALGGSARVHLGAGEAKEIAARLKVKNPSLWSLEEPVLYSLETELRTASGVSDSLQTNFGIRTVRFDPDHGFFLNGVSVKLKGTNNHQDHAGVGTALSDGLQEFRVRKLKEFGCNAWRCSHNPPTPELLDACDRLGMLVLPENRLLAVTPDFLTSLERMILRDRNHPSVIAWSIGNEEWAVEGNEKGARIAASLQKETLRLDPTRRVTAGISGGWGNGISTVIDVMGYNYIKHGNTDEHHAKFPRQPSMGTEESTTSCTRGVYVNDPDNRHMSPADRDPSRKQEESIETGWQWYAERPYLAGCFFWTGFDYRGESNPYNWPAVSSQFGILDICGFPKDTAWYLASCWLPSPFLKITPHWNWQGHEGKAILVRIYSNSDEVDLSLNGRSLGRKQVKRGASLDWSVAWEPGVLSATGYSAGSAAATDRIETSGSAAMIRLLQDKSSPVSNPDRISIFTVSASDSAGRSCPTADNNVTFEVAGPAEIIGVGNGDPASHEPDRYIDSIRSLPLLGWRSKPFDDVAEAGRAVQPDQDDSDWEDFFTREEQKADTSKASAIVYRGSVELADPVEGVLVLLFLRGFGDSQDVYINGVPLGKGLAEHELTKKEFPIDIRHLRPGHNTVAIVALPFRDKQKIFNFNRTQFLGSLRVQTPAKPWTRKLFNGLAQVIVRSTGGTAPVVLTAKSTGLEPAEIRWSIPPAP
jgi:beta-galactosidase